MGVGVRECGSSVNKVPGSAENECRSNQRRSYGEDGEERGNRNERKRDGMVCMYAPSLPVTAAAWPVCFFTARQTEGVLRGADHHLGQWLLHNRDRRTERQTRGEEREEDKSRNEWIKETS